ncbi:hypothetical protein Tco_1206137 [Tanacetum coccineum]
MSLLTVVFTIPVHIFSFRRSYRWRARGKLQMEFRSKDFAGQFGKRVQTKMVNLLPSVIMPSIVVPMVIVPSVRSQRRNIRLVMVPSRVPLVLPSRGTASVRHSRRTASPELCRWRLIWILPDCANMGTYQAPMVEKLRPASFKLMEGPRRWRGPSKRRWVFEEKAGGLHEEGQRLRVEGQRLHVEGQRLLVEGHRLHEEGQRLHGVTISRRRQPAPTQTQI